MPTTRKKVRRRRAITAEIVENSFASTQPAASDKSQAHWRTVGADSAQPLPGVRGDGDGDGRARANPFGQAGAVGRSLQSSFAQILRHLPARVGKVAQIARWLDLDRSICQRVVMGVRDATDGLGVLERFPGVRGLEQFIDAAARRKCPAPTIAAARDALDTYAHLVSAAGGSQARLVGEIEVMRAEAGARKPAPDPGELEHWRKRCYEGAVGLTGLASQARVEIVIVRPTHPGSTEDITTVGASGMIGVESSAYAMPLVRKSRLPGLVPVPAQTAHGAAPAASRLTPDLLLPEFTTQPPPRVTTRTEGEHLIHVFNAEGAIASPVDIVSAIAFNWTWGEVSAPGQNFYSVGRVIGAPARRLVFDLYLHRSLPAPRAVTAHVLRPGTHGSLGNARPSSRWFDRLPVEHDLTLLAGAPGDRSSSAYSRLGDLTRHILDVMHWRGEPFTGYRFELSFPVFDFEYVISADFSS